MSESVDSQKTSSRRALLQKGVVAGGVLWAIPTIDSFLTPAAAVSGTASSGLFKAGAGSTDPTNAQLCTGGAQTTTSRGSVTFQRTENPARLKVCITSTIGQPFTRDVSIYQSNSSGCLNVTTAVVGTFVNGAGVQCYTVPILSGATRFVVTLQISGGGGNDASSTNVVSLP